MGETPPIIVIHCTIRACRLSSSKGALSSVFHRENGDFAVQKLSDFLWDFNKIQCETRARARKWLCRRRAVLRHGKGCPSRLGFFPQRVRLLIDKPLRKPSPSATPASCFCMFLFYLKKCVPYRPPLPFGSRPSPLSYVLLLPLSPFLRCFPRKRNRFPPCISRRFPIFLIAVRIPGRAA